MEVLSIALFSSVLLGALLAASALARTGLRGRGRLLPLGCVIGIVGGLLELRFSPESHWMITQIPYLPLEILAISGIRALLYGLLVASAIVLTLSRMSGVNRRADVVSIAVAVGLGFGMATTAVAFFEGSGWPPSLLITAVVNLPLQVCFALLVASSVVVSRFERRSWPQVVGSYTLALTIQFAYQVVATTNALIGHWLAWLQPITLGAMWLGLILLLWLVGIAVMTAQARTDVSPERLAALRAHGSAILLSPIAWAVVAGLILAATSVLIMLALSANLGTMLGRVMLYTIVAIPLLSAAMMLKTAHTLRLSKRHTSGSSERQE